jgi:hypothetical protein
MSRERRGRVSQIILPEKGQVSFGAYRRRQQRQKAARERKQARTESNKVGRGWRWLRKQGQHAARLKYHYTRCPEGDIDGAFLDYLWEAQSGICPFCDRPMTMQNRVLEHHTPISRGGTNSKENVSWACDACNTEKMTKTWEEFMGSRGNP